MYQWLEEDMKAIDKEKTDWTIAFFHHPPYTHGTHNSDKEIEHIEMRENLIPLLEKYNIDFVFGGHSHTYERSILMSGHYGYSNTYDEKLHAVDSKDGDPSKSGAYHKREKGSIYCVAGNSGKIGPFRAPHLPFMKKNFSQFGSVILEADGKTMKITAIDDKQNVLDSYEVKK